MKQETYSEQEVVDTFEYLERIELLPANYYKNLTRSLGSAFQNTDRKIPEELGELQYSCDFSTYESQKMVRPVLRAFMRIEYLRFRLLWEKRSERIVFCHIIQLIRHWEIALLGLLFFSLMR